MASILTPAAGREMATRERSTEWAWSLFGLLPDPDEVLRKLGEDIRAYRALLTDAHVWACFSSRTGGTLAREWNWRIPEGRPMNRKNRAALDALTEMTAGMDMVQIITDILYAPYYGAAYLEITWGRDGGMWFPEKIEGKPPEWFGYSIGNDPRFISMENLIDGEPLPPAKFLIPRHFASYQNPYGERLAARCFWPVAFKRGGFRFWAIYAEKFGMPWTVGKVPPGTSDTERAVLLSMLGRMVQDAVAVVNADESIDIQQAGAGTGAADVYERLVAAGNREISKALLGQTLTTENDGTGSYAATTAHMDVRADLVDSDKKLVRAQMDQLARWICALNFPDAAPPAFAFHEDEDLGEARATRDKTLTEQGVKLTRDYYVRAYGFEESDIEQSAPKPDPAPAALPGSLPDRSIPPGTAPESIAVDIDGNTPPATPDHPGGEFGEKPGVDTQESLQAIWRPLDEEMPAAIRMTEAEIRAWLVDALIAETAATAEAALSRLPETPGRLAEIVARAAVFSAIHGAWSVQRETADQFADASKMVSPASFADLRQNFDQPFQEMIDYFGSLGVTLTPEGWRQLWQEAQAGAFTIAKITSADVLDIVKGVLRQTMEEGWTGDRFRRSVYARLKEAGFFGDAASGADLLSASRLANIFQTNMSVAFNVGRWKQIQEVRTTRPYLQYLGVDDSRTRPAHRAMHGRVYHIDDPIWRRWYPPNGFRCRCFVRTLSADDIARRGLTVQDAPPTDPETGNPAVPDAGWLYHPGEAGLNAWTGRPA